MGSKSCDSDLFHSNLRPSTGIDERRRAVRAAHLHMELPLTDAHGHELGGTPVAGMTPPPPREFLADILFGEPRSKCCVLVHNELGFWRQKCTHIPESKLDSSTKKRVQSRQAFCFYFFTKRESSSKRVIHPSSMDYTSGV